MIRRFARRVQQIEPDAAELERVAILEEHGWRNRRRRRGADRAPAGRAKAELRGVAAREVAAQPELVRDELLVQPLRDDLGPRLLPNRHAAGVIAVRVRQDDRLDRTG